MKKAFLIIIIFSIIIITYWVCSNFIFGHGINIKNSRIQIKGGTPLRELYNGSASSGDYPQSVGGVDDYDDNNSIPSDTYQTTWVTCDAANDYCGTNDATNAEKKDYSTGLVWSIRLDGGSGHTWFWANNCYEPETAENPGTCVSDGDDACQCVKKTSSKVGCEALGNGNWRLPHQKELIQAYINGAYGNLSNPANQYRAATTDSNSTEDCWDISLSRGTVAYHAKTNEYMIRCVYQY